MICTCGHGPAAHNDEHGCLAPACWCRKWEEVMARKALRKRGNVGAARYDGSLTNAAPRRCVNTVDPRGLADDWSID